MSINPEVGYIYKIQKGTPKGFSTNKGGPNVATFQILTRTGTGMWTQHEKNSSPLNDSIQSDCMHDCSHEFSKEGNLSIFLAGFKTPSWEYFSSGKSPLCWIFKMTSSNTASLAYKNYSAQSGAYDQIQSQQSRLCILITIAITIPTTCNRNQNY